METLALADVAKILHKSLSTYYTDLFRNPHRLPPRLRLPGRHGFLPRPRSRKTKEADQQ